VQTALSRPTLTWDGGAPQAFAKQLSCKDLDRSMILTDITLQAYSTHS